MLIEYYAIRLGVLMTSQGSYKSWLMANVDLPSLFSNLDISFYAYVYNIDETFSELMEHSV